MLFKKIVWFTKNSWRYVDDPVEFFWYYPIALIKWLWYMKGVSI